MSNRIAWNKGLTKETDQRVLNNTLCRTGRVCEKTKQRHDEARRIRLGSYYDIINNSDAWTITCTKCNINQIKYTRFDTYYRSEKKRLAGSDISCDRCRTIGTKRSDEAKLNMSIAAKNRNISDDAIKAKSKKLSDAHKKRYNTMSNEERIQLTHKITRGQNAKPSEEMKLWRKRMSESRRSEMALNGVSDIFKPSYNKSTILFIDKILNKTFNTQFVHAESDNGEFKIYDDRMRRTYYADAYCPKLNVWVEFDENFHFYNGNLKKNDIIREQRIKDILKCTVVRYKISDIQLLTY